MNKTPAINFHFKFERLALVFQTALFFTALGAYVYCISLTVIQVVLRQELMVSIQDAEARVSRLEAEYFNHVSSLSKDAASSYGLIALEPSAYIHIDSAEGKLTRNN